MVKPSAVLTSLEDSPPALDRRLVAAYLRTIYRVLDPAFDIGIGTLAADVQTWLRLRGFTTFAFVTAFNPGARIVPDAENERQHRLLLGQIRQCAPVEPRPAVHVSRDGDWPPEKSWWAPGLAASDALALADQFGQQALVFWHSGGAVELWWL